MTSQIASLEYRRSVTQQASVVGLVVALHDCLIGDLRRAAEAMEKNDIQTRCDRLIHGLKVLQQLDAMLDMENGGETANQTRRFYTHVRGQILQAQFKLSPQSLRNQCQAVFEVRQAWEQIDSSLAERSGKDASNSSAASPKDSELKTAVERSNFSCSM